MARYPARPPLRIAILLSASLCLLVPDLLRGAIINSSWLGGAGIWSAPANWSSNPLVPHNGNGGNTYRVTIGSGSVDLNQTATVNQLTLSGGTLTVNQSLSVVQSFLLSGGTLSGFGPLTTGPTTLRSGTLARDLNLASGNHSIQSIALSDGVTLTNAAGATLALTTGNPGESESFGSGTLVNKGTMNNSGSWRYYLSMPFQNQGVVNVTQGSLRLTNTGTHTGSFVISGGQLEFSGNQALLPSSSITGTGTLTLLGGTATLDGSVSAGTLWLNGGTLSGSGLLTPSTFKLQAGTLARNLTLTSGNHSIQSIALADGVTLTNAAGATLALTTGNPGESESYGSGTLVNQGTMNNSGFWRYYLSTPFQNQGVVNVTQGSLRLGNTGSHTGSFVVSGGQLEISGNQAFLPSSSLTGPGTLTLLGGTPTLDGSVSVGTLWLNGGTLSGSGLLTPSTFKLQAGTLARNLTLTSGNHSIQSIALADGVTLTNAAGATLALTTGNPGESESYGSGTLVNQGTMNHSGIWRYYLSTPFQNQGVVNVTQGSLRLGNTGSHTGSFVVSGGQLEFSGDQALLPSSSIAGPGTLALLGGTATLDGSVSAGTLWLNGGTLAGSGPLTVSTFKLQAGTLARNLTLASGGNHSIQSIALADGVTLTNTAGATLALITENPGESESFGLGTLVNQGTMNNSGSRRYYLSLPFQNQRVVNVTQGALRLGHTGSHTGSFVISGGQLEFSGDQALLPSGSITGPGTLTLLDGAATLDGSVSAGTLWLNGGTLGGSGPLTASTFNLEAGTLARDLSLSSASTNTVRSLALVDGATLTVEAGASLLMTGGTVAGNGVILNHGLIKQQQPVTQILSPLVNAPGGIVNVEAGVLSIRGAATQSGTFHVASGALLEWGGGDNSSLTLGQGAVVSGGGAVRVARGTLNVSVDEAFQTTGPIEITSQGALVLLGPNTTVGSSPITVRNGGTLSLESDANLATGQALVQKYGVLAIRNEFIPTNSLDPTSTGTLAIDVDEYHTPIDLAVLGSGQMSLGSTTASQYLADTLGPGVGNTYRLGGGGGTLTIPTPFLLTGSNSVLVDGPGTVELLASQSFLGGTNLRRGTLAVAQASALGVGPVTFQGGTLRSLATPLALSNQVAIAGAAGFAGAHAISLDATVTLVGSQTIDVQNPELRLLGNLTEDQPGRTLTKVGPGTLLLAGANDFSGALSILEGTARLIGRADHAGGTFAWQGGRLELQGDMTGSGPVSVQIGGTLVGDGAIHGPVAVGYASSISPGSPIGTLRLFDGLAIQYGGTYEWDLGSLTTVGAGLNWDQIVIDGGNLAIMVGASLKLDLDASLPGPGQASFWNQEQRWQNVIELGPGAENQTGVASLLIDNTAWLDFGTFQTTSSLSGNGIDLLWVPSLPSLIGDANGDCLVAAADYVIWAAQYGQTGEGLSADFDGNGSVGTGDYVLWAANFGNSCPPAATSVPEPSSIVYACGAAFLLWVRGARRGQRRQAPATLR